MLKPVGGSTEAASHVGVHQFSGTTAEEEAKSAEAATPVSVGRLRSKSKMERRLKEEALVRHMRLHCRYPPRCTLTRRHRVTQERWSGHPRAIFCDIKFWADPQKALASNCCVCV